MVEKAGMLQEYSVKITSFTEVPPINLFRLANGLVQPAMRRVHRLVPSTRNKIERLWGEVNVRVNLPFEAGLCAHGVE